MKRAHEGFVILFTILIAAVIMLIGLGIYSIATRESVLSGTAKEAEYAFYAADAGVECALYLQTLATANGGQYPNLFECGGSQIGVSGQGTISTPYEFSLVVDSTQKTCTKVSIFDLAGQNVRRVIAQGYNICNGALPALTNPLLVERDLDTRYAIGGGALPSATSTAPVTPQGDGSQGPDINSVPKINNPFIDGTIIQGVLNGNGTGIGAKLNSPQ